MKATFPAYLDLTLAMIIVGSSVVFGKIIVACFPVFLASGLRFAIASLILFPYIWKRRRAWRAFTLRDWGLMAAMSFCGQFIFTVLLLCGLTMTTAVEAGLVTSLTPAVMVFLSGILLKEKLPPIKWAGAGLVVLGVLAVNGLLTPLLAERPVFHPSWGNLVVLGAVLGEAVFLLLRKTVASRVSNLDLTAALCVLGFVFFLPLSVFQGLSFDFRTAGLVDWLAVLYFGAVFTVAAYIFWFRGVARVRGSAAGAFSAVMPVSAVGLSTLILGEAVTWLHGLGLVLVLAGILIITGSQASEA